MYVRPYTDPVLRRRLYRFRVQIAGVDYQERGFETIEDARDAAAALRTRLLKEKYELPVERRSVTLAELVAERVSDFDETKSGDRHGRVVLERFRDHFAPSQEVERLTAADLLSFKRARLAGFRRDNGRPMKANSINRELEAVSAMLNRAGDYFPSLAAWKHPALPYERTPEAGRERVVSREEAERLLAALRAPRRQGEPATASRGPRAAEQVLAWRTRLVVADLWELAPLTGMRKSEMRLMERTWVDFGAALVNIPARATKTRRARSVPLNDEALAILRRRAAESPHPRYLFANARGTNALGEYQMRRAVTKAARAAGLDYGQRVEGGFTMHDNRHTAATNMLQAGADLATVGDVLGHSRKQMTLRYSHATVESKRRAVETLGRKGGDNGGRAGEKSEHSETDGVNPNVSSE